MKKFFIILLASILIVASCVGGYFCFRYRKNIKNNITGFFEKKQTLEEEKLSKENNSLREQLSNMHDLNSYLLEELEKINYVTEIEIIKYTTFSALIDDTYDFTVNNNLCSIQGLDFSSYTLGELLNIFNNRVADSNHCLSADALLKVYDKYVIVEERQEIISLSTNLSILDEAHFTKKACSFTVNIDTSNVDFSLYGEINKNSAYLNYDSVSIEVEETETTINVDININCTSVKEWGSV